MQYGSVFNSLRGGFKYLNLRHTCLGQLPPSRAPEKCNAASPVRNETLLPAYVSTYFLCLLPLSRAH